MGILANDMSTHDPGKIESEPIEGVDQPDGGGWGDYPIDTVLIRTETRTIFDVIRRIAGDSFVMDPDFQRDFIWPEDKQSKLIESVLMRIPLPVFYLAEDGRGRMIVVDGLQRLSTFQRFLNNELRLRLPEQSELDKKYFKDLPPKLQNRVEDCNLVLYIIDAKVPERARLDIFERVNGGVPLTRQQMRNCLYMGDATRFLKEEAGTEVFLESTGHSLATTTMRDREFVNRFCAFQVLPIEDYRDMDEFLATALTKINKFAPDQLTQLSAEFRSGLENNYAVFEKHSFRKHSAGQTSRSVLNASLWDVMSTGLSKYPREVVETNADLLRSAFYMRLEDPVFTHAITYSTNSTKNVRTRFEMAWQMFEEVFGANPTRP